MDSYDEFDSLDPRGAEYVLGLAAEFPGVGAVVRAHAAVFDEVIAHVVFGDITRWADETASRDPADGEFRRFLARLDADYAAASDYVDNLIAVSFVENIDDGSPLLPLLGPNLRAVAHEQQCSVPEVTNPPAQFDPDSVEVGSVSIDASLANARSDEWFARALGASQLRAHIADPVAYRRLVEMLDDENTAVIEEAVESLVLAASRTGLIAVLEASGRSADNAGDHIDSRLADLWVAGFPLVDRCREVLENPPSEAAGTGAQDVVDRIGGAPGPRTRAPAVTRTLTDAILVAGLDDWVPLAAVDGYTRQASPDADPVLRRQLIAEAVADLVSRGLVIAGHVTEGGFTGWDGDPAGWPERVTAAMAHGEIGSWGFAAWLSTTPSGDDEGRAILAASQLAVDDAKPRWLFWAERPFADLRLAQAEGRAEEVTYRIPGHGSGWCLRVAGLPVVGLVRYEFGEWYGPNFPHGSRLVPTRGSDWEPDERADRCVMLGSDSPGDPITTSEAEAIIVQFGFPISKLYEPRPGQPLQ